MPEYVKPTLVWFRVQERSNGPTSVDYRLIDVNPYSGPDGYIDEVRTIADECNSWDHNYRGIDVRVVEREDVPTKERDAAMARCLKAFDDLRIEWERAQRFMHLDIAATQEMCV